eukprot:CAMPEP_0184741914 /NCGR_PEP_ID=MMETSP0315-20130426/4911_1 /TAXON_ID=101924 /ORGANISM="Rhodosorus marinus, Strain UTEX LB 2760" /LENGTH=729 /DNA_ID=CAMNT_0027212471 /DNA_START=255 /DNA_END=2444 /DNA_ORIENTATION=-
MIERSIVLLHARRKGAMMMRSSVRGLKLTPFRDRKLSRLEREALSDPSDSARTLVYLKELGGSNPEEVIRKVEKGDFIPSDGVAKEYVRALVRANKLDMTRVAEYMRKAGYTNGYGQRFEPLSYSHRLAEGPRRDAPYGYVKAPLESAGWDHPQSFASRAADASQAASGASSNPTVAGVTNTPGTPYEPIHVSLAEPSFRAQMWKSIRGLGVTFLLLAGLRTFMEDRGIGKTFGINTDVQPEPGQETPTLFEDVKGCDEAKAELEEIVQYLKSPQTFTRLGGKLPKGVLLVGPPGTGKTLLARAIAGEAGVPFFYASGSEFEEMFVGVGARRVRELFTGAKKRSPCIIFIDEIDAIGGTRNPKDQQYMKMTLNQLLVELDGFNPSNGIIVIGATNFPESLDKALVRPGRFDRHVVVPNPDVEGRRQILELHTKDIPLSTDVDLSIIARGSPGFSGAELANLANTAALRAALEGAQKVAMEHLEFAKDKILMGAERKSAVISEATRKLTAYHEGGHALMAIHTNGALPVHKATIVPRGVSLGMVSQLPEKDMTSMTRTQMLARVDVCMGGRAAEELIFGADNITSGAESDFDQATKLAEAMVTRYGMSERLGQVVYDRSEENLSGETKATIDSEVKRLLDESYARATALLKNHEKELHNLASALLAEETLNGEEVMLAAKGLVKKVAKETVPAEVPLRAPEKATIGDKTLPAAVPSPNRNNTVGPSAPTM